MLCPNKLRRISRAWTADFADFSLGWSAVRVRDLTRGGYKEQVRGYCRDARNLQTTDSGRSNGPAWSCRLD